jgi:hypothetical protein
MKMNNFIKLTSTVINKSYIITIVKKPGTYYIHMNKQEINGFMLFSFGHVETEPNVIKVCETDNQVDYYIIKRFVDEIL